MVQLNALDLSSNNISHIDMGAFDLRRLEYVSLAHNDLSSVAAGVFGEALDTMWVTDNANLTCDQVERSGALPSGANCVDDSVCGHLIQWFGSTDERAGGHCRVGR